MGFDSSFRKLCAGVIKKSSYLAGEWKKQSKFWDF